MRTCPKEEETVETCDGMNQKNIIFDKSGLKKTAKLAKSQKNKLMTLGIGMREKIDLSIFFKLLLAFPRYKEFYSFPKVCNTFVFLIGVIDFIG